MSTHRLKNGHGEEWTQNGSSDVSFDPQHSTVGLRPSFLATRPSGLPPSCWCVCVCVLGCVDYVMKVLTCLKVQTEYYVSAGLTD